jgi:ABC-type lipoprotein release transport system permease subunit
VVAEARHWRAGSGAQPEVYVHYAARPEGLGSQVVLLETTGSPRALFRSVERRVRGLDRNVPVRVVALTDALAETLRRERLTMAVLAAFALVVLVLALAGVAGVVARAVAHRRREVGIRLALGATPGKMVRLLQAEALIPAAAGAVLGSGVALAASRTLASLLHDVSPTDAPTYFAVAGVLAGAAFLASLWPARRALAEDPVSSIRNE